MRLLHPALLAAALPLLALPAGAQQERAVFVARVQNDTLAVEVVTRRGDSADAVVRYRTPLIRVRQTVLTSADGMVRRIRTEIGQGAAGDSALRVATLTFTGDSALVHAEGGAADRTIAAPVGAVPFLNLSGLSIELVLRRARALGGDSVVVPVLVTGASRPYSATVVRAGRDSVTIALAGVTLRTRTDSAGRLLGASVPAQQLTFERLPGDSRVAAWTGAVAPVSYAAPAGAPYTARDVVIAARAGALAGTLTMPAHASRARVPAVILISGSGAQDRDESTPALAGWRPFREIADTLSRRGIAVLRLDDRGVGGSAAAAPLATLLNEADDVRDAVAWLRTRAGVDPARIGLLGHSTGGVVAPMVAAGDPRIRAVVLVAAPASSGRQVSEYQLRSLFAEDSTRTPAQRDSLLRVALRQSDSAYDTPGWLRQFGGYDPLPAAARVRAPALVLHGETDRQVPAADAARLAKAMRDAGNRAVVVRTFPRMNHLLVDDPSGNPLRYHALPGLQVRADLRGVLADWLVRTLSAGGG